MPQKCRRKWLLLLLGYFYLTRVVRLQPSFFSCLWFPWHLEADVLLNFPHGHHISRAPRCSEQMVNVRVCYGHTFSPFGDWLLRGSWETPPPASLTFASQLALWCSLALSGPVCHFPWHLLWLACLPPLDMVGTSSCLGWKTWLLCCSWSSAHMTLSSLTLRGL